MAARPLGDFLALATEFSPIPGSFAVSESGFQVGQDDLRTPRWVERNERKKTPTTQVVLSYPKPGFGVPKPTSGENARCGPMTGGGPFCGPGPPSFEVRNGRNGRKLVRIHVLQLDSFQSS